MHAKEPLRCQFKINPSSVFQSSQREQHLYFSLNGGQSAQELIAINQFEAFISHLSGYKFIFSHDVLINDLFTLNDLPSSIDGDMLYQSNIELEDLLKKPRDFNRYELRYINFSMGLGVFSRYEMKTGDIIAVYSGIKTAHRPSICKYMFERKEDCLKLVLDGRQHGNITRFINHAPSADSHPESAPLASGLEANVEATHHYLKGIEIVVYSAKKNILPEEQLLVDYGKRFFEDDAMYRFKIKGRVIDTNIKSIWHNWQKKVIFMRVAAQYGVKKAQLYLFLRFRFS